MGTLFDEVKDIALMVIRDYKLDSLYENNSCYFEKYTDGILIKAIGEFSSCLDDLSYNSELRRFYRQLSNSEISILADYFVIIWFKMQVQDVTQFNLHLKNRDFQFYSEGQNLKEKSAYLDKLNEDVSRKIVEYQNNNIDKIPFFNE